MTPGPGASKSEWRRHFREQLSQFTLPERALASVQLCQRLEGQPEWQQAGAVLLFVPTAGEPDILPLAQTALSAGKVVVFPRYNPVTDSYDAARVGTDPDLPLLRSERGRGPGRGGGTRAEGSTEPKGPPLPSPLLPPREERESAVPSPASHPDRVPPDLVRDLAPGRFGIPEPRAECPRFSLNELDFCLVPGIGFALDGGRIGRGRGYFDRLLSAIGGFKCGVAFDCQVAPRFALEPHDVCLDCILTPTRWHPTAGRARS